MYYSLRGTLIHLEPSAAIIECGGVGYRCITTTSTLAKLPPQGQQATLYTHLVVREDALTLFGFADEEELNCFKMLTTVSKVGPKVAVAILSNLNPQRFALCVVTGDYKQLTQAPGVGPKLAQRIVLELKDKIDNTTFVPEQYQEVAQVANAPKGSNLSEAISALMVLGYSQGEAAGALSKMDPAQPVEDLIKQALKRLASGR